MLDLYSDTQTSLSPEESALNLLFQKHGAHALHQFVYSNTIYTEEEYVEYLQVLLQPLKQRPDIFKTIFEKNILDFEGNNLVQIWIKSLEVLPMLCKEGFEKTASDRVILTVTESYHAELVSCIEKCLRRFIEIYPTFLVHQNHQGKTVLHTVCQQGDVFLASPAFNDNFIVWLNKKGASFITKDIEDNTPLHDAAAYGCAETVKLLLKQKGILGNQLNRHGDTPLHFASNGCLKNYRFSDYSRTIDILLQTNKQSKSIITQTANTFFSSESSVEPAIMISKDQYGYHPAENIEKILQLKTAIQESVFRLEDEQVVKVSYYDTTWAYLSQKDTQEALRERLLAKSKERVLGEPATSSSIVLEAMPLQDTSKITQERIYFKPGTPTPVIFNESMQAKGLWTEAPIQSVFYRYKVYKKRGCSTHQAFFELFYHYSSHQQPFVLLKSLPSLMHQFPEIIEDIVKTGKRNKYKQTIITIIFGCLTPSAYRDYQLSSDVSKIESDQRVENLNRLLQVAYDYIEFLLKINSELVNQRDELGGSLTPLHQAAHFMHSLKGLNYPVKKIEVNLFELLVKRGAALDAKDHAGKVAMTYYPAEWRYDSRIPAADWEKRSGHVVKALGNKAVDKLHEVFGR